MGSPELTIDGAIATITFRRPEVANRIGPDDLAVLMDHFVAVDAARDVLVLLLRAEGKYFSSGYDIGRIGGERVVEFEHVVNTLEELRPVTIAVLQGGVYGGSTDLVLSCDFRMGVPATDAFMPAVRLGLHYYQRGLERYVSRLGLNNAKRMFLTAGRMSADELKEAGFLTHLVRDGSLDEAADKLAATMAAHAPLPLLAMKKNLNRIAAGRLDVAELERDIAQSRASEDLQEGRAAFAERRAPRFKGR